MKYEVILTIIFFSLTIPSVFAQGTSVILTPSEIKPSEVGAVFTVEVRINNVIDLNSWTFAVKWDPEILEMTQKTFGDFLSQGGSTIQLDTPINNQIGELPELIESSLASDGVDGNGLLATLTFKIKKETPSSEIKLEEVGLYNSQIVNSNPVEITGYDLKKATVTLLGDINLLAVAGPDQTVDEGKTVTLDGTQSIGEITSYKWAFTDGSEKELTGSIATYTFNTPGEYNIKLTVTKGTETSTDELKISVQDITPPTVTVTTNGLDENNHININGKVEFDASQSYDHENGEIKSFLWNFGDGSTSTQQKIEHTFTEKGVYNIRLTIKDKNGNAGTYETQIIVGDAQIGNSTIDVYTNKKTNNGIGKEKPSDSYEPFEEIELYAIVRYNSAPKANAFVSYQIQGPPGNNPIKILRSASTNSSGISKIAFRIPGFEENTRDSVIGKWEVEVTTQIGEKIVMDYLTFNVKWLTNITSINIMNKTESITNKIIKGEQLKLKLDVLNYANTTSNINIYLKIMDSENTIIYQDEIPDIKIDPKNKIILSHEANIPESSLLGEANIIIDMYPSFYKSIKVEQYQTYIKKFTIYKRELSIIRTQQSYNSIMEGSLYDIEFIIKNEGLQNEKINLYIYYDEQLIDTMNINLEPNSNRNIRYEWNTTDMLDGNYTISVNIHRFVPIQLSGTKTIIPSNIWILAPTETSSQTDILGSRIDYHLPIGDIEIKYPNIMFQMVRTYSLLVFLLGAVINSFLNSRR